MAGVTRLGDNSTGHPGFGAVPAVSASGDVTCNGIPVVREGDAYEIHCCGSSCHSGALAKGSSTVTCNGKALGRQGDPKTCSKIDRAHGHSGNSTVGG